MSDLDDPTKPPSVRAVDVTGPDAEGTVLVRACGVLDASTFGAALARAVDFRAETVVIDLLEVEAFSMEAAGALLKHHCAGTATASHRRLLLRPSPAVVRKLEQLGLTAVLLDTANSPHPAVGATR